MNLEESNEFIEFQKKKNKRKKIIAGLILFSIFIIVLLTLFILFLKQQDKNTSKLYLNGRKITWSNSLFISQDQNYYVSTREMSKLISGEFMKGEYMAFTQDEEHCYIQTKYEVIAFTANEKYVKKYIINDNPIADLNENQTNTNTATTMQQDVQYIVDSEDETMEILELSSEAILLQNGIYVPTQDIEKVFNVSYYVQGRSVYIYDLNSLYANAEYYLTSKPGSKVSNIYENVRALADDFIVYENSNGKYGVIEFGTGKEILSPKYTKVVYMQNVEEFFVYTDDTVGVLDKDGLTTVIEPTKYDSLTVFDEINKLYLAKQKGKYGVLDKKGTPIIPVAYTEIGMKAISDSDDFAKGDIENKNLLDSKYIIVLDDTKLGLYNLKGEIILNPRYEAFGYVATEADKKEKIKSTLIIPKTTGIYGIIIKQNGYYGIFDLNNQAIIPCSFTKIYEKNRAGISEYYLEFGDEIYNLSDYLNEYVEGYGSDNNDQKEDDQKEDDQKEDEQKDNEQKEVERKDDEQKNDDQIDNDQQDENSDKEKDENYMEKDQNQDYDSNKNDDKEEQEDEYEERDENN